MTCGALTACGRCLCMKKIENPSGRHLRLELPSAFEHLEPVVDATEAFLARHVEDEDFAYRVVLLVSEAVTNAIQHGNRLDEQKMVSVEVQITAQQILVTVTDEGHGFKRDTIEDPRE